MPRESEMNHKHSNKFSLKLPEYSSGIPLVGCLFDGVSAAKGWLGVHSLEVLSFLDISSYSNCFVVLCHKLVKHGIQIDIPVEIRGHTLTLPVMVIPAQKVSLR